MLPTIKNGCKLKVNMETADIGMGDIAVFKRDKVVCHRIVGRYKAGGKEYFLEKGDNRKIGFIRSVSSKELLGKVTAIGTPGGKFVECGIDSTVSERIRYLVISIFYSLGYKIKNMVFGARQDDFTRKISFRVLKVLNYLA